MVITNFRNVSGCNSVAALNENNSSADTMTVTTTVRTSLYRVFASIRNICATSPEGIGGTGGLRRVSCSRVLRLTALNTRILGGHSIRVTGGCGVRLRILSDVAGTSNAVMGRGAGVRGVLVDNITGSASITEVSIVNIPGVPNLTFGVFSGLSTGSVGISVVLRSVNRSNGGSVDFAITGGENRRTITLVGRCARGLNTRRVLCSSGMTGVSVINTNVRDRTNITAGVFRTLCSTRIGVRVVDADRVGISILVSSTSTSGTMDTVRDGFFSW